MPESATSDGEISIGELSDSLVKGDGDEGSIVAIV